MTKTKGLRALVPNSYVETLCMAMFRAGVTETSYPAHPGMAGAELAELAQLTKTQAIKSAAAMVERGRAVVTTPHKRTHRRYVLSAAQVVQCAARLRGTGQETRLTLFEQIIDMLAGARHLTSSEIVDLAAGQGFAANSVHNRLTTMWKEGQLHRSGSFRSYVYSLPTQPAETAEPLTPVTIEGQIVEALSGGRQLTTGEIASSIAMGGVRKNSVYTQLRRMWKRGEVQRSGEPGCYAYSLLTQPAEHTEPAETAELSNSDHTDPSIVQATIDAFHQAGEPLSDEQIEALHHMHPDRHRVLCDRVAAKALAKVRQEREAREAHETALFEEYLQAAVEAEQMELLDT